MVTQGDVYPYNSLVGYAFTSDLKYVIFETMRHTRKFRNLCRHVNVSMLIDSRANNRYDFKDAVALTVLGKSVKAPASVQKFCERRYGQRFPHLKDFVSNPGTSIVLLKVRRYIFVEHFQQVCELKMQ